MPDLRPDIRSALDAFTSTPLRQASLHLLKTLGYASDRVLDLGDASPESFRAFIREHAPDTPFDEAKALFADWKSAEILFQLTDDDLSAQQSLFKETEVQAGLLRSYLFFAIELTGPHYARGKLTAVARQLNRVFPMPVMVLIKHLADKKPVLSIAVINRRQSKREAAKDVLGKVTIIRDISLADPHRGHLDILDSVALANLNKVGGAARPLSSNPQGQAGPATDFLTHLHKTLNAPSHPIRNRLDRLSACDAQAGLTTDSPDLLGVIKEEGKV